MLSLYKFTGGPNKFQRTERKFAESQIDRRDFACLGCQDVFMWNGVSTNSTNVVSTNRCLSAVCSISGALSLPALSTSARHLDQTDIFFCLEMLMDHTSCPPVHLVESENVTKDNFSPVIERSGKHLRPDGAGAPILANLTHGSHSWPRESGKFQPVLQFYSG